MEFVKWRMERIEEPPPAHRWAEAGIGQQTGKEIPKGEYPTVPTDRADKRNALQDLKPEGGGEGRGTLLPIRMGKRVGVVQPYLRNPIPPSYPPSVQGAAAPSRRGDEEGDDW